jgi:GxxExxY protein
MDWKQKIEEAAKEVMEEMRRTGLPYEEFQEKDFEEALMHEFRLNKIPYERQRNIEIIYKGYSIGISRPDCIINPGEKEFLCEIKRLKNVQKNHIKQAEVYLISLNISEGCILNFNYSEGLPEIIEVKKPDREWKSEIQLPKKESEIINKEILLEAGKEVMNYLGTEFQYQDKEANKLYANAINVELRLRGINFYKATYPIIYKGHEISTHSYDYVFEDGSTAIIFIYKSIDEIDEKVNTLNAYNKLFGIKKGYIIALPSTEKMEVEVREILNEKN